LACHYTSRNLNSFPLYSLTSLAILSAALFQNLSLLWHSPHALELFLIYMNQQLAQLRMTAKASPTGTDNRMQAIILKTMHDKRCAVVITIPAVSSWELSFEDAISVLIFMIEIFNYSWQKFRWLAWW
jgi:hypothetical protein